jgi:SAM-dependent methyltransferase
LIEARLRLADVADALARDPQGQVIEEISPNDVMYTAADEVDGLTSYLRSGKAALRLIRLGMFAAQKEGAQRILDFGCGHGRVLRFLKAEFPWADLTACDINPDAVEFCARVFGATPVPSNPDPQEIEIGGGFDLIWSGSVFSHVDAPYAQALLRLFHRALTRGGLLVFTTAGRHVAERMRAGELAGLAPEPARGLLEDYDRTGHGYRDYEGWSGQGLARLRPAWMCRELAACPGLRLLILTERGWDRRQDVFACMKD